MPSKIDEVLVAKLSTLWELVFRLHGVGCGGEPPKIDSSERLSGWITVEDIVRFMLELELYCVCSFAPASFLNTSLALSGLGNSVSVNSSGLKSKPTSRLGSNPASWSVERFPMGDVGAVRKPSSFSSKLATTSYKTCLLSQNRILAHRRTCQRVPDCCFNAKEKFMCAAFGMFKPYLSFKLWMYSRKSRDRGVSGSWPILVER